MAALRHFIAPCICAANQPQGDKWAHALSLYLPFILASHHDDFVPRTTYIYMIYYVPHFYDLLDALSIAKYT